MKIILQRAVNTFVVLTVIFAVSLSYSVPHDRFGSLFGVLGFGLAIVLMVNYIIFGVLTLWHKFEKSE